MNTPQNIFNILILDDNGERRHQTASAFSDAGHSVIEGGVKESALESFGESRPDLVVLTVPSSAMQTSFELSLQIHASVETKNTPVIIRPLVMDREDVSYAGEIEGKLNALSFIQLSPSVESLQARAQTLLEFKAYLDACDKTANTDALTSLPNRRRFDQQLSFEINRSTRFGHQFCLVIFDLDHFKTVNDTYGHDKGDEVLQRLAECATGALRQNIDLVARIGGEEFALILPETNFVGAAELADRLRIKISEMRIPEVGHVTSSFGISEFPLCAPDAAQLFAAADSALYKAKRTGRNRVCVAGQYQASAA